MSHELTFNLQLLVAVGRKTKEPRWIQNRVFQVPSELVLARISNKTFLAWLEGQTDRSLPLLNVVPDYLDARLLGQTEYGLV